MKNKGLLILLWLIVVVLQLIQIVFVSTTSYLIYGNELLAWLDVNLIKMLIHGGGFLSFPILGYLLYQTNKLFNGGKISLMKILFWFTVFGLVSLLKYYFPFGVDFVSLIILSFSVVILIDITRLSSLHSASM